MPEQQAITFLESLLGKTLRIHITDGRMFIGEFKCTDRDCNVILALTHEYRHPTPAAVKAEFESLSLSDKDKNNDNNNNRNESNNDNENDKAKPATETKAGTATGTGPSSTAGMSQSQLRVNMESRFVGLVVVPGQHITKIEVEGFEPEEARSSRKGEEGQGVAA